LSINHELAGFRGRCGSGFSLPEVGASSSLSDLKEIGCKMTWPVHISPLSCANMNNYWLENRKNLPSTSSFFASIL